jgi:hypothetical protein
MANSIVRTSKVVKNFTSGVRTHFDVFDRARDIYLNQIKKAESDYFDRIRRATELLAGEEAVATAPPSQNGDDK